MGSTKLCADCDERIPEARLKVQPDAEVCIKCQAEREKSGKFQRSRIEVSQEISGWQCEAVVQTVIPGGVKGN